MSGELQTIDACLGIATAVIRLTDFCVRLKKASDIGKQIISTAAHVCRLLEQVKESLRRRGSLPDDHALKAQDDAAIQSMLQTMKECRRSLRTALVQVFGEKAVRLQDFSDRHVRSVNIAFHPENLAILKSDLQQFLLILNNYEHTLLLVDNIIARNDRKALQSTLETYLQHSMQSMVQFQGLRRQLSRLVIETRQVQIASPWASRCESQDGRPFRHRDQPQTAEDEMSPTDSFAIYDGLQSSREIAEQTLQWLVDGPPSTNVGHGAQRTTSRPDMSNSSQDTSSFSSDKGEEEEEEHDPDTLPTDYPLSLLEAHIETFRTKSYQAQIDGAWPEARRCLESLIKYSEAQAKQSGRPFEEELKFEHMLVVALVHLDRYPEALDRLDRLSPSGAPEDQPTDLRPRKDTIREAHLNQLRAFVMLDKFTKSQSRDPNQVPTKEIREAKAPALKAFTTYNNQMMETNPTEHVKAQYPISAQLFAMILQIVGKPEESDNVLAEARKLCGQEIEPVAGRRDSAIEDLIANPLGETAFERLVLTPSNGTGNTPDTADERSLKLIDAIRGGNEEDIIALLDQYPDATLNETDEEGSTVLHHAAERSTARLVRKLAEHSGSDVGWKDNNQDTALIVALESGQFENAKCLAAYERCVLSRSKGGWTALHHAVDRPKTATMTMLLQSPHVDELVQMQASGGMTALHYCVQNERPEHASILLERCQPSVIDLKNAQSKTALDMALTVPETQEITDIIDLILDKHAKAAVAPGQKESLEVHTRRRVRASGSSDGGRSFGLDELGERLEAVVSTSSSDTSILGRFRRRRSSNRRS